MEGERTTSQPPNFSREECLNLESALRHEWLETDGCGGYASSTILDCHTRKYHGLLSAPVATVNERQLFVSKVEPILLLGGKPFPLSTNKYPGVFHPTGHQYIESAAFLCHPEVTYRVGDVRLRRALLLVRGEHTLLLRFEVLSASSPVTLQLHLWLAFRNIHALTRQNMALRVRTFVHDTYNTIHPYEGLPPLFFDTMPATVFYPGPYWVHNVEYLKERARGFPYQEDLFCPGILEATLHRGNTLFLRATLQEPHAPIAKQWTREVTRRETRWDAFTDAPLPIRHLMVKGEDFVMTHPSGEPAILAGYPWFDAWGRDAMIAVPGLAYHCGFAAMAEPILQTFVSRRHHGVIPNFLAIDESHHAYNAVDTSLWMILALQRLAPLAKERPAFRQRWLPLITDLLHSYATGAVPNVACHSQGLLWTGSPDTQLTWMDAKDQGVPVTPRHGYAVEINALWFNALLFHRALALEAGLSIDGRLSQALDAMYTSFGTTFWLAESRALADVVNEHGGDPAIRPNQLFAVALPASPLSADQQEGVMEQIRTHLVTPYGLRTLAPNHPAYRKAYVGGPAERDAAYHQGTIWPWLIGAYVDAERRVATDWETTRTTLLRQFRPLFLEHPYIRGLGSVSEVFDAAPPHRPRGTIAQAWSVAEVLRAWHALHQTERS